MKKKKSPYPKWIDQYRKPSTEIRKLNNNFYVYEVSAYYDKERKKGRKKTGRYLGRITEKEGFIEARSKKVARNYLGEKIQYVSTKEYGFSAFIQTSCKDIVDTMKIYFPQQWEWILVAVYCRLIRTSPLKNMGYYFSKSYLSEQLDITVSAGEISQLLRDLGRNRKPITDFMKHLAGEETLLLIDATSLVSYSKKIDRVNIGLSKNKNYEPIFNLLYFYSPESFLPAYYRLFNGNIKDVKMLAMAVKESQYKEATLIADKGFFSEENIGMLEKEELQYIVPLRRNSNLIDYKRFQNLTHSKDYFLFEGRVIYFTHYKIPKKRTIYLFIDEQMMMQEKKDFICRTEKGLGGYSKEDFLEHLPQFGTFSVISNKEDEPESIFLSYKSRMGIEVLFDGTKNVLGNDFTYMQNDDALEGWMFINHIALLIHHKIYSILKEKKLISRYSIRDFIEYLSDIKKVKINTQWICEPMVAEQQKLVKNLGITIP